mmetsp:Transcript_99088/g.296078  ORF Transcript_99088/g.296078 Transcript_99088/m.296078 type:complete len:353 (+) Transcript_99088:68-1126(+)
MARRIAASLALALLPAALAQVVSDLELQCGSVANAELFACWRAKYEKLLQGTAVGEDLDARFHVFEQNLALIREHNANPLASWTMDANEFAAHTWEEFSRERLMAPQDCSATHGRVSAQQGRDAGRSPPSARDWRLEGVVTPVKNQQQCGSCWTFSTTGVVESHLALATKRLVSLSEQQLVDCAGAFNNHGCGGGLPSQAMEYIHYNGGLESEEAYPYTAKDGKCSFDGSKVAARVADVVNITQGGEEEIFQAVGSVGPVSIAYDCTPGFQLYRRGVWDGGFCGQSPSKVNHAVLAVGYGHDGKDYWLVKNSWGGRWGEDGYFRIVRNKNKCGLADCASYPKMQTAGPSLVV